jgi:hypothetical protein
LNKRRTQRPFNLPVFPCTLCELDDLVDVVLRRPGSDLGLTRVENAMRRIVIAIAAPLAILAAGSITPNRAAAMTVTTPSGMQNALNENSPLQDVAAAGAADLMAAAGTAYTGGPHRITAATHRITAWW